MYAIELKGDAAVPVARLLLAFARGLQLNDAARSQSGRAHVDDEGLCDAAARGSRGCFDHQAAQLGFDGGVGRFVGAERHGDFVVAFGRVEAEEERCAADARGFNCRSIAVEAETPSWQIGRGGLDSGHRFGGAGVLSEDEVAVVRRDLRVRSADRRSEKASSRKCGFGRRSGDIMFIVAEEELISCRRRDEYRQAGQRRGTSFSSSLASAVMTRL